MSKPIRLSSTEFLSVGDVTSKGTVDSIYDLYNLVIDGMYYDLRIHKILLTIT